MNQIDKINFAKIALKTKDVKLAKLILSGEHDTQIKKIIFPILKKIDDSIRYIRIGISDVASLKNTELESKAKSYEQLAQTNISVLMSMEEYFNSFEPGDGPLSEALESKLTKLTKSMLSVLNQILKESKTLPKLPPNFNRLEKIPGQLEKLFINDVIKLITPTLVKLSEFS